MSIAQERALHCAEFWVEGFCREIDNMRKGLRRVAALESDPSHVAPRFLKDWEGYALADCGRAVTCIGTAHGHLSFIFNAER